MNCRPLFLFIFMSCSQLVIGQSVWSGDVNNNGIVNKVDLLYLGYAFGETGPSRTNISTAWMANNLPEDWEGNFPNGLNYLYADCNGDGKVDEKDAEIILQNAGLIHDDIVLIPDEVLPGEAGVSPACRFMNSPVAAPVNQLFKVEIGLGDLAFPIENMSGITFTLDVEPDILGVDNTELIYNENAWIEPDTGSSIQLQQTNKELAKLKVAFSKTNRVPISGSGPMAKVSFLIEEDIVDFLSVDTFTVILDSIIVLDDELQPIPIIGDTLKLAIDKNLIVNVLDNENSNRVDLYPNPNKGMLLIASEETPLERIELYNELGQQVFNTVLKSNNFQSIDFQHLGKGIYWVKIYSEKGIITKKIQKY